jgi:hypothetical protein
VQWKREVETAVVDLAELGLTVVVLACMMKSCVPGPYGAAGLEVVVAIATLDVAVVDVVTAAASETADIAQAIVVAGR